jgi:DNA-binding MarR family transcriptional regulator
MLSKLEKQIYQDDIVYTELLLEKTLRLISNFRKAELTPYKLSHREAHTLYILYKLGRKVTTAEIAKYREKGQPTICVQINKMKKDGLVKADRHTPNSHVVYFELTEKGLATFNKITKLPSPQVISVLSDEERHQLIAGLEKVTNMSRK